MAIRKLKVAASGLGRMGKRHALHFLHRTPRAELVAAFSPDEKELAWAKENLEPYGVKLYSDYDQMLNHEGLEAVVIATVTTVHAEQAIKAIEKNLHTLCEKPLSTSVQVSQGVVDAAKKKPHLKVMCGFSRRFDASYRDAFRRVQSGAIGKPAVFRSQTCDKLDPSGFFVAYAEFSGGIFVDCNVHDIDLCLWFYGSNVPIKSVSATGITAVQPDLAKHGDFDNGIGVIEFWDGKMAVLYGSRMNAAGQHDMTEIIGTEGIITVNATPAANLVEMAEATGFRREIPQTYYDRFEQAFVTEANEFTASCLDNTKVPLNLDDAVKALVIGASLQESCRTGQKIWFDKSGKRTEKARL